MGAMSDLTIELDEFIARAYEYGARDENEVLQYVNLFTFNNMEEEYILQRIAEIFGHNDNEELN